MVSSQLRKYTFLRSLLKFSISSKCSHYLSALTENWLSNQDSSCHLVFFSFSGHTQFWKMAFIPTSSWKSLLDSHAIQPNLLPLHPHWLLIIIKMYGHQIHSGHYAPATTPHSILLASIHTWMSPLTSVLQALSILSEQLYFLAPAIQSLVNSFACTIIHSFIQYSNYLLFAQQRTHDRYSLSWWNIGLFFIFSIKTAWKDIAEIQYITTTFLLSV